MIRKSEDLPEQGRNLRGAGYPMDLADKKGTSQIERTGLGFLFWGAMRNLFRYILNGYSFSFLILGYDLNI
jgi:hypothetical protein